VHTVAHAVEAEARFLVGARQGRGDVEALTLVLHLEP
jgi:hypothetical protein